MRGSNRLAVLLGVGFVLAATVATAQAWRGDAGFEVRVSSRKGGALAGARVEMMYREGSDGSGPASVTTDAKGRAALGGLAAGTWQIEVSHPDFMSYVAVLRLRPKAKPEITASFLEAIGESTTPIRVKLLKYSGGSSYPPLAAAPPKPAPAPAPQPTRPEPAAPKPAVPMPPVPEPEAPEAAVAELPPPELAVPDATPVEPPAAVAMPADPAPAQIERPEAAPPVEAPRVETEGVETPRVAATAPEMPKEPSPTAPSEEAPPAPSAAPDAPAPDAVAPDASPPAMPAPEMPAPEVPAPGTTASDPPAPAPIPEPPSPTPPLPESFPPEASVPQPSTDEPPTAEPTPPMPAIPAPGEPAPSIATPLPPAQPPQWRAYQERTCPECRPGEWAVTVAASVGGEGTCGEATRDAVARALTNLAARPALELSGFAGGVEGAVARLGAAEAAEVQGAFGGADTNGCRILGVVLPKGSRFVGFQYEIEDGSGRRPCLPDQPCPGEQAAFAGPPRIARGASSTVIHGLAHATVGASAGRAANALMTVFFRAPNNAWTPER